MLATFRNMASGYLAKLLLGLLVLSFGVWGIGDIFRSGGDTSVAAVNGSSISEQELNNLIDLLQRNFQQITPEAVSDPYFKLEVLNNLINERLMRSDAERIGLAFSRDELARMTSRNPMFQKADGSFDRELFLITLQQNNHTEQSYMRKLQDELTRSTLYDTLKKGLTASNQMAELYEKIRNEEREATIILIGDKDIKKAVTPDDETLRAYLDEHSEQYMNPEYRTMSYISFDAETIWKQLKLEPSDDALKAIYEERKDAFVTPESRKVQQMLFSTEVDATKAYEELKAGKSFTEVAKSDKVINKGSLSLGTIVPNELPVESAEAVFSLQEGGFSKPTKSSFGWHVFSVDKVNPLKQRPFKEVRARLLSDYRAETAETEVTQLGYRIEDALAAGSSLKDALEQNQMGKLKIKTLGPISATNQTPKEKTVELTPLQQNVLKNGFGLEAGETSTLSISETNAYYLVQLDDVVPQQLKPFEDVKAALLKSYMAQENQKTIKALAFKTANALIHAENIKKELGKLSLRKYRSGKLKRTHDTVSNNSALKNKILTSGFVLELFRLKEGQPSGAYPLPSGEYVIGVLDKIHTPKKSSKKRIEAIRAELNTALPEEVMQYYLSHLRNEYDVSIQQERLFGAEQ